MLRNLAGPAKAERLIERQAGISGDKMPACGICGRHHLFHHRARNAHPAQRRIDDHHIDHGGIPERRGKRGGHHLAFLQRCKSAADVQNKAPVFFTVRPAGIGGQAHGARQMGGLHGGKGQGHRRSFPVAGPTAGRQNSLNPASECLSNNWPWTLLNLPQYPRPTALAFHG